MRLRLVKSHLKNGWNRGRTVRPRHWLYPVLVLAALVLLAALGSHRGYALGGCAWHRFTAKPVMDVYSPTHLCQGEKPPGRLGDDGDDDDDDGDEGTPV